MRVSANDVYRMAQRAVEGAGAPPGLDLDAAQAAEWLELAGFPGVAALATDLDAGRAAPARCRVVAETAAGLRFANASGLLVGAMAIEWCLAQGAGRRRIDGLASPLGLLRAAAERAAECGGIAVAVGGEAAAHFPAAGDARSAGDWSVAGGPAASLLVATEPEAARLFAQAAARLPASDSLDAIRNRHLRSGIEIEDATWERLMRHARRILVPPSAISRARGAGSGKIDDND
jgi:hypothetical protein